MEPTWISKYDDQQVLPTRHVGPLAWAMLHGLYNSLHESNQYDQTQFVYFLRLFGRTFPCIYCRRSIPLFIKEYTGERPYEARLANEIKQQVEAYAGTKKDIMKFLHARVNLKLATGDAKWPPDHSKRAPFYGTRIRYWNIHNPLWRPFTQMFLAYALLKINSYSPSEEDPRNTDIYAFIHMLNQYMTLLNQQQIDCCERISVNRAHLSIQDRVDWDVAKGYFITHFPNSDKQEDDLLLL